MNHRVIGARVRTVTKSTVIFASLVIALSVFVPKAFCGKSTEDNTNGPDWYENLVFKDESFSSQLARASAWTYAGSADIGEVISTARRIKDGDIYSWHEEWLEVANRVYDLALDWEEKGHTISASEAFFRAATYFQTAGFYMVAPEDKRRPGIVENEVEKALGRPLRSIQTSLSRISPMKILPFLPIWPGLRKHLEKDLS